MTERVFYHGTSATAAHAILRQGFKIGDRASGRNLGNGLYLTEAMEFAAAWGSVLIRIELRPGTRILWHTPVDQRTIQSLRKEFGAGITQPNFDTVIARNKQLTKSEVAHLWNYLVKQSYLHMRPSQRDQFLRLVRNYPTIYKHLKRHGYDGVGISDKTWPEMFLFNPSSAVPLSAHSYTSTGWRDNYMKEGVVLSEPLSLAQLEAMDNGQ